MTHIPEGAEVPAFEFLTWFFENQPKSWLVKRCVDSELLDLQNPMIAEKLREDWAALAAQCEVSIRGF